MAERAKRQRKDDADVFYEAIPIARQAPDHDFAAIEDDGRAVAIRTLVFVALATAVICLLLIWGVQMAREVLPATGGSIPPGR